MIKGSKYEESTSIDSILRVRRFYVRGAATPSAGSGQAERRPYTFMHLGKEFIREKLKAGSELPKN
jgi:hypothetical protein